MSGRKIGGGRVLGNGKGLVPPAISPAAQRATSPYAASDSSQSVGPPASSSSAGPSSPGLMSGLGKEDLASNISVGRGGPSNGEAAPKLVCPICEDEMLTLLQLNRHIDDTHQELPSFQQDEVKTWFDKQVIKAKRFQPLSLINQKLRGLDVFESNESSPIPPSTPTPRPSAKAPVLAELPIDPDELITRSHWQRQGFNDVCTEPACGRGLGAINGNIHCRSCGRLFCEEHTMYQMKLSRAAKHDPVRGYWVRVCETCYKSRDGYNDHNGFSRDQTSAFAEIRRKRVERQTLEVSRLEKRLTKLTQLLASPPPEVPANANNGGGSLLSLAGQNFKNQRKAIEQTVVTWEEDAAVTRCPFCQQEFGSWTFRRHHCRICGRVVCADPQTGCSSEVGLNVANPTAAALEKPDAGPDGDALSVDIRMCRDCKFTIFAKRDFLDSVVHKPPDQRAYETLRMFERGITLLLPNFQRALLPLQDESNPPSHEQIQEAAKLRKRLMDSFTKYDIAAKRIRDMRTASPTQQKLQKYIYQAASTFLHMHMLSLKNLPQLLKRHASASRGGGRFLLANGHAASPLRQNSDLDAASVTSETSTVVSALETEEKDLRERLVVLEEQRHMVRAMIDSSKGARRFEEVGALTRNADELDREIDHVRKKVLGVEERWQGLYANGGPGP